MNIISEYTKVQSIRRISYIMINFETEMRKELQFLPEYRYGTWDAFFTIVDLKMSQCYENKELLVSLDVLVIRNCTNDLKFDVF